MQPVIMIGSFFPFQSKAPRTPNKVPGLFLLVPR